MEIVRAIATLPQTKDLSMTTNGFLLAPFSRAADFRGHHDAQGRHGPPQPPTQRGFGGALSGRFAVRPRIDGGCSRQGIAETRVTPAPAPVERQII